jgi:hypothetical protein
MPSLYEITQDLLIIQGQLEENDGELTPELEQALTITEALSKEKLDNYCKLIYNIEAETQMYDTEIKRLQAKKKAKEKIIDRLAFSLESYMKATGKEKIELDLFKLSFRSSKAVNILSEDIPTEYLRITTEPNKVLIKEALTKGEVLPFAELKTNQSLQIK